MIIILTGLPGSGKSVLGKYLSHKLDYLFIDLDQKIESITNTTIANIFISDGETNFRKKESLILKDILLNNKHNNLVLSLGGGTFTNQENINLCKIFGHVFWLNTCLEIIVNRLLAEIENRPIFNKNINLKQQIKSLYNERKDYYKQADTIIDIDEKLSLKDIFHFIIENIK